VIEIKISEVKNMAKKAKKQKVDSIFKIGTKNPNKSASDFMKTVKSGKGNLGKSFFKI
jgi:hypothetical protein